MMRFIVAFILSFLSFAASAQTTQILGAPGTRIATKGDMSVDSIFYLPRTLVTSRSPIQAGALRYQSSDSALYQWTGTAWRKAGGGDVDTLLLSTRAWRQKGIDSVASVRIGGSGVTGYIPKFTAARTLDSSQIFQLGGNIGIATATPDTFRLNVNGAARTGTLTVNTNGQAIRISTNQASGTNGNNIFIGTGGTALNGTGFQSSQHVAIGVNAADAITTANNSVSVGAFANQKLTTGNGSIAIGTSSLQNVTSGSNNVAMGVNALSNTTTSGSNVAIGVSALQNNITGSNSTAIGTNALQVSTTNNNVGIGSSALGSMTSGSNATAVGTNALLFITTASNNTAIGYDAGRLTNASNALQTAANSTFIGNDTRASADGNTNEIVIGHSGRGLGSNSVVLGNSSITNTYLRGKTLVNTTTDAGYQFDVAGTMRSTQNAVFATSATIGTQGAVGIGTTTPALANNTETNELTVTKSGSGVANIGQFNLQGDRSMDGAGTSRVGTISFWQTSTEIVRINGQREGANNSGNLEFLTNSAGSGLTSRMRITAGGDIGIGNTSPSYRLDITGSLRNTTSAFFNTSSGETYIGSTTDIGDYKLQVTGGIVSTTFLSARSTVNEWEFSVVEADTILKVINRTRQRTPMILDTARRIYLGDIQSNGGNNASLVVRGKDKEVVVGDDVTTFDDGAFPFQVKGVSYASGGLRTGAPAGGTAATWKLGTVASVSPTSPNRTIEVDIGGTIYYIHAKTTND